MVVVLPDGKAVRGSVTTAGPELRVAAAAGPASAPLADVAALRNAEEQARYERYLAPPPWDLWGGYIDLAYASAQGNARTTVFTTAMIANRITNNDKISTYFNQIQSRARIEGQVADTAQAVRGGWSYNRNLHPKMFWNAFNDYEYDRFQNLDLRMVLGSGLGYHLFKRERGLLDIVGGGAWNREKFATPIVPPSQFVRNSGEVYWGDDLLYRLNAVLGLKQSFRMFNNLTSSGEYRMNFDLGLDAKVFKWLSWQVTGSDRYLSNPAPGRKTNDLLISTGIRVSFASPAR